MEVSLKLTMIQIKPKNLKEFRKKQWQTQKRKCAVTGLSLPFEESVVDHCHKTKAEEAGIDGKGLIRGVIHRNVNQLEGKILSTYKRYGLNKIAPLPFILRQLADYLEHPPTCEYLHPSCIPKVKKKKLNKTDIKRVLKYWKQMYPKRKQPEPTKTLTKQWERYIEQSKKFIKRSK